MQKSKYLLIFILLSLLFNGCKQLPKEIVHQISNNSLNVGVISYVKNTMYTYDDYYSYYDLSQYHRNISHWKINSFIENEISNYLANKKIKYDVLPKGYPYALLSEGEGKGFPSFHNMLLKDKINVVIRVIDFTESPYLYEGISFSRSKNIITQNVIERVRLNLALSISLVEKDKLKNIYFAHFSNNSTYKINEYSFPKNSSKLQNYLDKDLVLEEKLKKLIKEQVNFYLGLSGI